MLEGEEREGLHNSKVEDDIYYGKKRGGWGVVSRTYVYAHFINTTYLILLYVYNNNNILLIIVNSTVLYFN